VHEWGHDWMHTYESQGAPRFLIWDWENDPSSAEAIVVDPLRAWFQSQLNDPSYTSIGSVGGQTGVPVTVLQLSPDDTRLFVAMRNVPHIQIYDAFTGEMLLENAEGAPINTWGEDSYENEYGNNAGVLYAVWSPDGSKIAGACKDGTVKLWDSSDLSLIQTMSGFCPSHQYECLLGVEYSHDGTRLLLSKHTYNPYAGQLIVLSATDLSTLGSSEHSSSICTESARFSPLDSSQFVVTCIGVMANIKIMHFDQEANTFEVVSESLGHFLNRDAIITQDGSKIVSLGYERVGSQPDDSCHGESGSMTVWHIFPDSISKVTTQYCGTSWFPPTRAALSGNARRFAVLSTSECPGAYNMENCMLVGESGVTLRVWTWDPFEIDPSELPQGYISQEVVSFTLSITEESGRRKLQATPGSVEAAILSQMPAGTTMNDVVVTEANGYYTVEVKVNSPLQAQNIIQQTSGSTFASSVSTTLGVSVTLAGSPTELTTVTHAPPPHPPLPSPTPRPPPPPPDGSASEDEDEDGATETVMEHPPPPSPSPPPPRVKWWEKAKKKRSKKSFSNRWGSVFRRVFRRQRLETDDDDDVDLMIAIGAVVGVVAAVVGATVSIVRRRRRARGLVRLMTNEPAESKNTLSDKVSTTKVSTTTV